MTCEHGWRHEVDCDLCTARRVMPALDERLCQLEAKIEKAKKWAELQIAHPGCLPDAKALLKMLEE